MSSLNPAQREAVTTVSGPLLVLAGAGTGKTRVVTYRIAELIRRGTSPAQILAVTFTNKAATEMHERSCALLGRKLREKPEISTFHSLCVRILRRHARALGYPEKFAIYDRSDQESLARGVLREIKVDSAALRPGELLATISQWKSRGLGIDQAAATARSDKQHLASMAYRRYQKALRAAGAMDFDDLLLLTDQLLGESERARAAERARFSHLLVDEYQDTNAIQYRIVKSLAARHRNLCVVGDDDQSIYGWRGAEVAHILRFKQDWPEAKVVRLEENYRSTAAILELANRLILFNAHRHDKVLRAARPNGEKPYILQCQDETDEARRVVADIRSRLADGQVEPRDFAILFRTNEQPRPFELELRRSKLPYVLIGGMSFYDRKEVRDLLAYLRVVANPRDELALLRIINTPARGIGERAVTQLLAKAVEQGQPLWDVLQRVEHATDIAPGARTAIENFSALMSRFRAMLKGKRLVDVASSMIDAVGYRAEIERLYKDIHERQSRMNAIEEVINALGAYAARARQASLEGFLEEVATADRDRDGDKESQLERNAIALMTLHSAKGLEFPQVYLVGMEEGLLPHRRSVTEDGGAIDEERRLCYVGLTRAQDRLTMSLALSRMKWGKPRPTVPSRFLLELTGQAQRAPRPKHAIAGQRAPRSASKPGTRAPGK